MFLKDLEHDPFILLDQNCTSRRIFDERFAEARITPLIHMELSSIEVIKRLVRIDVGISVVPEISVREEVETKVLTAVRITDLERTPGHDMAVIYKQGRYQSLAAESFLRELKAYFCQ